MIEIEGYSAIEQIGHGGLGDVYRATRTSTGGVVAVKVLRDVSDESVAWLRTRRELTALVALAGHANVIQLIELLELPEGPALVMELAPGGSVAELLLRRDGPLSTAEAILIGRQTAGALVAAHDQGIVHRDVKPQNLLIDAYGQVKLCDFGIAAIARSAEFQARTSALSMRYASPEDLDDEVDVGPAADVYSLGATLLHLVHGAPPTLKERLAPWDPPAVDDEHVAALDAVIARCLRPDPAERPTAATVLEELERLDRATDDRSRALDVPAQDVEMRTPDGSVEPALAAGAAAVDVGSPVPPAPSAAPVAVAAEPVVGGASEPGTEGDETVARPGRRRAARPVAAPARSRGRGGLAAAAAAIAVAALIVAIVAATRGDDDPADDTSDGAVTLVDRPEGLAALAGLPWPSGGVGECVVQSGARVTTTACAGAHDLERVAVGQLDGVDTFDAAAIRAVVEPLCAGERDRVAAALDSAVAVVLDAPFTVPTADSWAAGDRRYECWVGVEGRRLVGSVAGR